MLRIFFRFICLCLSFTISPISFADRQFHLDTSIHYHESSEGLRTGLAGTPAKVLFESMSKFAVGYQERQDIVGDELRIERRSKNLRCEKYVPRNLGAKIKSVFAAERLNVCEWFYEYE